MYVKEISEIEKLIQKQAQWRNRCINLIASENIVSQRVRAQAGSDCRQVLPASIKRRRLFNDRQHP